MKENILIKAKFDKKRLSVFWAVIPVLLILVAWIIAYDTYEGIFDLISRMCDDFGEFFVEEFFGYVYGYFVILAIVVSALIPLIISSYELVVTDKRVYGKSIFGIRVNLPIDKISFVGLGVKLFSGIIVSTCSGKIKFYFLENREEVYRTILKTNLNVELNTFENFDEKSLEEGSKAETTKDIS